MQQSPNQRLPPGWVAHWDAPSGRTVFIETATGRSQPNPPTGGPQQFAPQTPSSQMGNQYPQQPHSGMGDFPTQTPPPGPSFVPNSSGPTAGPRSKRVYAANQAQAYYGDSGVIGAPNDQTYQATAPAPTPFAQPLSNNFSPGQSPLVNQSPMYANQPSQPAPYGQPGFGGSPGPQQYAGAAPADPMAEMTQQFQGMGMGQKHQSFSTVNLVGAVQNPSTLSNSPPAIRLPPGVCITQHSLANADPSYKRCTLNAIPTSENLLKKSKIPLALIITPYRSVQFGEPEVPVVTDTVIARCRRCRTYINPYVTFIDSGTRWKCCMCNLSNEVPQLFDFDRHTNQPVDRWQRAELNHSVVEFVAPTEYMVRPPQAPTYVFLIDVSYPAISSGMVATAARTLLETLDRIPNQESRTRIAIIAVDTSLHFFSLTANSPDPCMLVVGDVEDVFLPKASDLLVNLTETRPAIEALVTRLSDMFKDTHCVGNAMGPALQAAYKLISHIGGKIMVLNASLPTLGPGALKVREDPKILGTAKESTLLQAATGFYKTFAIDCSRSQVSVDMWLFSSVYADVASLSCLPRYTGGNTYFYPAFNAARSEDALKFAHEFGQVLASIRLSAFHGNFFVRSTDLLALPAVPMDQSYAIELQIEDPISMPFVVFQTGVLHTTSSGERRIRVITLALPTTSSIADLYATADPIAIATLLANKAVERSMQARLEDARDAITNKLVDILGSYKSTMTAAGTGPSPQLVISENLKILPLILLGLLKHVGLRQSSQIPSDMRAYAQALLTTLPSQLLIPYLYPTMYSLHNMPTECGTVGEGGIILPPQLNATSERLERHGLFLIEDSQNIFLWVGREAVPQLIMDVFDLPTYQELRGGKATLSQLDNPFSQRVTAIVGKIRESRRGPYYPHLYIVKEDGEPSLRMWALSMLVEDRQDALPSYHQYITTLKDKVNSGSF
ncbi:Sec23/Sec24 trunk domain-domain-containing protein [Phakopsora pachyrhizi]|uniref:Sec23/Sec24 trunk domain-domain-containing protein n=1 Tax=Phakopsora pachyrhizi TaxID=170000 RepID=A0AAV0AGL4_PHAPC|nr:Sec23/Sec24 trunk domain-domain-containing protein [Phakopsora pachyrhizi]